MTIQKPKAHFVILLLAVLLIALADHMGYTQQTKTVAITDVPSTESLIQLAKTD